jgi:hypothetical protein
VPAFVYAVPGMQITIGQPIGHRIDYMLWGTRAGISINLFGPDLHELWRQAERIRAVAAGVPGTVDVVVEQQADVPQVRIARDRAAMARYGGTPAYPAEMIDVAFAGEAVSSVLEGQQSYALVVRFGEAARTIGLLSLAAIFLLLFMEFRSARRALLAMMNLPLALAGGEPGDGIQCPMAIVVLGGLLTAVFPNMVVAPALFLRCGAEACPGGSPDMVPFADQRRPVSLRAVHVPPLPLPPPDTSAGTNPEIASNRGRRVPGESRADPLVWVQPDHRTGVTRRQLVSAGARTTVNVHPSLTTLVTVRSPPMSRARCRLMERPSPIPSAGRVRLPSACTKGSKIASSRSSGIPHPLSVTRIAG